MNLNKKKSLVEDSESPFVLSQLWQKSVVAGTFWGTLEIVLGSTLHNLMIPMAAGTVLSFCGVLIMSAVSTGQIQRGLFWRAALVCALLKSVSPSAVILTPMLGILFEGVCMELGVFFLGRNIVGQIVGGGLAVFSVPLFRVLRLFMMYGSNVNDLYAATFSMSNDFIGTQVAYWLIIAFSSLYFLFGFIAVLFGRYLGKSISISKVKLSLSHLNTEKTTFHRGVLSYMPILYFLAHLFFLSVFLIFISKISALVSIIIATLYILVCVKIYPRARFPFHKVWLLVSIALFSFVVPLIGVGSISDLSWVDAGVKISLRALLVVVAFAAIGTELGKPGVGSMFSGGFFQPVYLAVSLAFNSLPDNIERIKDFRIRGSNPLQQIRNMMVHSIRHIDSNQTSFPVIIICGERGEGKTSFIKRTIEVFAEKKIEHVGFYAQGIGGSDLRSGYSMVELPSMNVHELCIRIADSGNPEESFQFYSEVLKMGEEVLCGAKNGEVVIIDEIGKLELRGLVWANALTRLLENNRNPLIITVRKLYLQQVIDAWKIKNPFIVDINKMAVENVMEILEKYT